MSKVIHNNGLPMYAEDILQELRMASTPVWGFVRISQDPEKAYLGCIKWCKKPRDSEAWWVGVAIVLHTDDPRIFYIASDNRGCSDGFDEILCLITSEENLFETPGPKCHIATALISQLSSEDEDGS